jgi:hypothetical protein
MGLWLLAPWGLGGYTAAAMVNSLGAGLLLAGTACVGGTFRHRFAGGWSSLWRAA